MNKLYYKLFMVLFIAVAISGCKLDPPIYPEGTVANPGAGGGISTGSTITYTIDGKTTTLNKNVIFQVIAPGGAGGETGNTQIGGGTDISNLFTLSAKTVTAGNYDAILAVGTMFGEGMVTFTELNTTGGGLKGTVKGTFTGEVTDIADVNNPTSKTVTGSFDIKL